MSSTGTVDARACWSATVARAATFSRSGLVSACATPFRILVAAGRPNERSTTVPPSVAIPARTSAHLTITGRKRASACMPATLSKICAGCAARAYAQRRSTAPRRKTPVAADYIIRLSTLVPRSGTSAPSQALQKHPIMHFGSSGSDGGGGTGSVGGVGGTGVVGGGGGGTSTGGCGGGTVPSSSV